MSERDNDRLDQFFRKAASKPDVTFNEDDWKRLEVRLDAQQGALSKSKKTGSRIIIAAAVTVVLLSGGVWLNARLDKAVPQAEASAQANSARETIGKEQSADFADADLFSQGDVASTPQDEIVSDNRPDDFGVEPTAPGASILSQGSHSGVTKFDDEKVFNELIQIPPISSAVAEKIKQKAVVDLPGAEEETRGAEAVVREEHASEQKKHESLPRLSLLLSFAPDFSSTSYMKYTTPGQAYGAVVHYHILSRWSVSAGAIRNYKKYRGAGEDYHPPKGYWKYYTNGVVPNSIDGSCSVLEFPVMVQYTLAQNAKNRWTVSGGASSYLMLSESYRYNFDQPNPGSREGWDSRNASRFLFNMVNFTIGFERRVLPGLMIGIEPYVKIPLEEIGWSNLKLYSTGASFTLRYNLVRRQIISTPTRSRGPD